jgi:hypothetical protein
MQRGAAMPAFDVARRWKGRVVLDRGGSKLLADLDEEDEEDEEDTAVAQLRGCRPAGRP